MMLIFRQYNTTERDMSQFVLTYEGFQPFEKRLPKSKHTEAQLG